MARVYTAGSQGADANCAKTWMEGSLHTALTAVYTYVEQVINGTKVSRIYKSPGASNVFGQDWYLITRRGTDADTNPTITVCEQYNSTTHLCFNYPPVLASQVPTAAPEYAVNDPAGKAPDSTNPIASKSLTIGTSGFQYWYSITPDRAIVAARSASNETAVYAGLYKDFLPASVSKFPLITTYPGYYLTGASATAIGYYTREPGVTTAVTDNFRSLQHNNMTSVTGAGWLEYGTGNYHFTQVLTTGRTINSIRGSLYDVYSQGPLNTGANGDTMTMTINGVPRQMVVVCNNSGNYERALLNTEV